MKLRIKGNSVRYRLTQSEVKILSEESYIEEVTHFGTEKLIYAISVRAQSNDLEISMHSNKICLFLAEREAKLWFYSDRITYQNTFVFDNGQTMSLLLEKDFVCLDHSDEDQSDNYPNPNKTC